MRMPERTQTPTTSAAMAVQIRDFADRDPFVPDSTATFTVVLGAAIPDAFHRLPSFRIIAFVYNIFSLSLGTQVGQVIGFQIVFS